jgi:hypothetical protein
VSLLSLLLLPFQDYLPQQSCWNAPDLLREQLFIRDLLQLLLRPSKFQGAEGLAELCQLLEALQQQVRDSPFGVLLEQVRHWQQQLQQGQLATRGLRNKMKSLEAIAYCIKGLRFWQPNEWRRLTNSTVRSWIAAELCVPMLGTLDWYA